MAHASFEHGETGITRFPPNVEQISINVESTRAWLVVRRNDTELRFPLERGDCEKLIDLLKSASDSLS